MLSVYTWPGQWSVVNSMFILNNWSLFIDEGRASLDLPIGQARVYASAYGKPGEG